LMMMMMVVVDSPLPSCAQQQIEKKKKKRRRSRYVHQKTRRQLQLRWIHQKERQCWRVSQRRLAEAAETRASGSSCIVTGVRNDQLQVEGEDLSHCGSRERMEPPITA
jgi:hypothetical protein